jgi:hypothetical protein
MLYAVLRIQIQGLSDPWIRDRYKIKIRIRDEIPDHISDSLETIFGINIYLKIHKFFDEDADL